MPNPKRVIFVIDNFVIGGVEKLLLGIISRLDKQKFTSSIITVLGSGSLEARFCQLNIPISCSRNGISQQHNKLEL